MSETDRTCVCCGMGLSGGGGGCGEGVWVFVRVCVRASTATPHVTSKFVWGKLYFCFATTGAFLWIFARAKVAHKQQCSACCSVAALLVGLRRRGALVGGCVVLFPFVLCVGVVAKMSGGGRLLPPFLWFLLSRASVVRSVAIYIPIYLGTRPCPG